jgi:hypothetical protein
VHAELLEVLKHRRKKTKVEGERQVERTSAFIQKQIELVNSMLSGEFKLQES